MVARDIATLVAINHHRDLFRLGVDHVGVDRGGDDLVDMHDRRHGDRVVTLESGQLDDLLHEAREPVALIEHPSGEPMYRSRVVRSVLDCFGQEPNRADRGLELVADVGDEVTADRVQLTLARPVLNECEHQVPPKWCNACRHRPLGQRRTTV